ncbi:hypothetical protein AZI87_11995 [Bdellovibrio bacteriovorus]|uniref:Uncharacterized protein n=1 Tax=Bdellovibrio bacteriovorus TaxID=959 RepID=A0A161PQT1_BDEBC|nr:hypothetical protein [Bdellovibrio bacteriovorus]KYG65270.1 hypothetical protein AZI87_11995 [Bdellovibrio bacteriovorus]
MGGSDPISSAVKSATSVVNNVVKETGNALESGRKFVEGGDIGKIVKTATQPIVAPIEATAHLARGNVKGAVGTVASAAVNNNPVSQVINSSDTVKKFAESDTANNLTLGWSRDAVRNVNASERIKSGNVTDTDLSDMVRYNVRSAAYAAGGGYLLNKGYVSKAVDYAVANPTDALVVGKLASEGKYEDIGKGVLDTYIPGASDVIDSIFNPAPAPQQQGPYEQGTISTPGGAFGSSTLLWVTVAATAAFIFTLLLKKMRK